MWKRTRPWFLKKCCSSRCTMTGGEVCQGIVCTEEEFSIIISLLLREVCRFYWWYILLSTTQLYALYSYEHFKFSPWLRYSRMIFSLEFQRCTENMAQCLSIELENAFKWKTFQSAGIKSFSFFTSRVDSLTQFSISGQQKFVTLSEQWNMPSRVPCVNPIAKLKTRFTIVFSPLP